MENKIGKFSPKNFFFSLAFPVLPGFIFNPTPFNVKIKIYVNSNF